MKESAAGEEGVGVEDRGSVEGRGKQQRALGILVKIVGMRLGAA